MTLAIEVAAVEQCSTRILLEVSGPVDMFTCAPLVAALRRAVGYCEVMVDLSRVTHFSAAGVHALEEAEALLAERGGLLRLVAGRTGSVAIVLRALDMQDRWPAQPGSRVGHAGPSIPEQRQGE
jgi:anti-anti-sigma regulatory factor